MKDKNNKKGTDGLFKSSKIIESIFDAKYDLSQLQILSADGLIPFIDSTGCEGARLLFFQNIPSVAINTDKQEKSLNRCLVEIRISISTLKMISEIINYELQCFEKDLHDDRKCELKTKNYEHYMFG